VEETPPSQRPLNGGGVGSNANTYQHQSPDLKADDLFIDLTGNSVGFSHWHPTPVTNQGDRLCGQSDLGGLWEWTSTSLAAHEGFKAMDLYPGYTADFFDDKHNVCLGGSWATVPRIAGRKSFVNWYQRNYAYVWCTARLVRDIAA
jgi:formylglycine-generating enzyme required for sulfatase activity